MSNEELIALIKKNPISVVCLLLCLALGAGIYFRGDLVPAATDELTKKSEEGQRLAANLQNAAQLKEQVDTLEASAKEIDSRLVHAGQPLSNYQYFYKLVSDTGTKMSSISSSGFNAGSKGATKALYGGVPFAISITGSMTQTIDYLRRLENGSRYCRIMSVTGSVPLTDRNLPLTLNLNLELLGLP